MGLKLRWFRRRITFEGIPSAPERSSRKKENTGITVIGVYRQSVNYEDYVEPSRSSYWTPTNQPIATAVIRKPTTSAEVSSSPSYSSSPTTKSSEKRTRHEQPVDKIASKTRVTSQPHFNGRIATPPEPSYSPPQPPVRRALAKTKSTPDLSTVAAAAAVVPLNDNLAITRSIEVLNDEGRKPISPPTPRPNRPNKVTQSASSKESSAFGKVRSTSRSPSPTVSEIAEESKREQNSDELTHKLHHQQPEYFTELLGKINDLAMATKSVESNQSQQIPRNPPRPTEVRYSSEEDVESFDDIFEKVKAKPRSPPPAEKTLSQSQLDTGTIDTSNIDDIEHIFEPRPPEFIKTPSMIEVQPTTPQPEPRSDNLLEPQTESSTVATKPLKSILKKRAPVPPIQTEQQQQQEQPQPDPPTPPTSELKIPIPPPRSVRKEEPVAAKRTPDPAEEDDDDDYLAWNMVERHRSSITHTVAAGRVDPDILRNVPSSLKQTATPQREKPFANARAHELEAPPRTLRGMRNQQQPSSADPFLALAPRESASRDSEASA